MDEGKLFAIVIISYVLITFVLAAGVTLGVCDIETAAWLVLIAVGVSAIVVVSVACQ